VLDISVPLFLAQDRPPGSFEVIVVADGPDPEVDAVMARLAAPGLKYAALAENAGPAAARNKALEMAEGRYLVFVDDDSLILPDFLSRHLAAHAGRDDLMVSGPIIDVDAPPDMAHPPKVGFFDFHLNPLPTLNGSVLASHVAAAGGFDEVFRVYGWEDPELCWRLKQAGLKRKFIRNAPIYHFKPVPKDPSFAAALRKELHRGQNGRVYYEMHPHVLVGLETKQWGPFHAADRLFDPLLGLERKMRAALDEGWEPSSGLMRALLLFHAEISGGRAR
jgi:Predicted glycosyltransferases